MNSRRSLIFLFFVFSLSCLRPPAPAKITPLKDTDLTDETETETVPLAACPGDHLVFSIISDGLDVGREVRTALFEQGPFGPERVVISHLMKRMKLGTALFDNRVIKFQRTLVENNMLLRASEVSIDQLNYRSFLVGYNGNDWDRLVDSRSTFHLSRQGEPVNLSLSEGVVVGFHILDLLRDVVLGEQTVTETISYYDPLLDQPVELTIGEALPDSIDLDGQTIEGHWIEASRVIPDSKTEIVLRAFFDTKGSLWVEEYPELHQVRRRLLGSLSFALNTSELLVGLRSDAYVGDPNAATKAVYKLTSTPDRLDGLDLLSKPYNHVVKRISPGVISLEVTAGAPDVDDPVDADLSSSRYILPNSPEVKGAYRYLRSAGKRGHLSEDRRLNATPVISRVSLIKNPKVFWKNPQKVASIMMSYVSALLPDKRHTFSMFDAVTTLNSGSGDCTEHAVLFASLMRAAGIPSRLVSGMFLSRGGIWILHMWNEYWDGGSWQTIDPSSSTFKPGALYVALGHGSSRFEEIRSDLSNFMVRTFSGVSFDLVSANNNGSGLYLARPSLSSTNASEFAVLNAIVLSDRGDHEAAIKVIENNIPKDIRTLRVKMSLLEFTVKAGRHDQALEGIKALRKETSEPSNLWLLNKFELDCLLTIKRIDEALEVFERMTADFDKDEPFFQFFKAHLLFGTGQHLEAIGILKNLIEAHPDEPSYLVAFAQNVALTDITLDSSLIEEAYQAAYKAVGIHNWSNRESLFALTQILFKKGRSFEGSWFLDHSLVLSPSHTDLLDYRKTIPPDRCIE